jgi:hypothetical protein
MISTIGISGKKGSGKNTVASIIQYLTCGSKLSFKDFQEVDMLHFHKWDIVAFADKLKEITARLLDVDYTLLDDQDFKSKALWVHPNSGIDITPRYVLQFLGTELGRELHPDIWIKALINSHPRNIFKNLIITDVRFPNETKFIKENKGIIIRVNRPGLVSNDTHSSETSLDNYNFDIVIENDSTVENLIEKVKDVLTKYSIL